MSDITGEGADGILIKEKKKKRNRRAFLLINDNSVVITRLASDIVDKKLYAVERKVLKLKPIYIIS